MFKKKKGSLFTARPEPPSVTEIIEDLTKAPDNDIVFTFVARSQSESPIREATPFTGPQSKSELDSSARRSEGAPDTTYIADQPDIETIYQQASDFIQMVDQLKRSPEMIQSLCAELRNSGRCLQESVGSLYKQNDELKSLVK